jgi:hypothetical protein
MRTVYIYLYLFKYNTKIKLSNYCPDSLYFILVNQIKILKN